MTREDAWRLTYRLREEVSHEVFFAHVIFQSALPEDLEVLERLIRCTRSLRSESMSQNQKDVHYGMKVADRTMKHERKSIKPAASRVFRIARRA